ncbi:MAG: hypothetical protein ABIR91_03505, partial [Candidatus Saccharimonadales bacterium]
MKHLVVTVSTDSSVQLLASFADVILLDKPPTPIELNSYDTLYIRSVFSQDTTLPQLFRSQIDTLVRLASRTNPTIYYIDDMDTVDQILTFEDKWHEYQTLGEFMPSTQVYDTPATALHFAHSVFKKRLSSRGTGVTWNRQNVTDPFSEWIVQDSLDIAEELRIYAIR